MLDRDAGGEYDGTNLLYHMATPAIERELSKPEPERWAIACALPKIALHCFKLDKSDSRVLDHNAPATEWLTHQSE